MMHGAVHSACVAQQCLNTNCLKWFRRNNGHLTLQIWTPCLGNDARCFESFICSQRQFLN